MKEKKCTKCGEVKPLLKFSKNKNTKDGLQFSCKDCYETYRIENREKILQKKRQHYYDNIDKIKEYREDNAEAIKIRKKRYRENNSEYVKAYRKKYRKENIEAISIYNRNYHKNNREYLRELQRNYRLRNREHLNERKRIWASNYKKNNKIFYIKSKIRSCVIQSFRRMGYRKNSKTQKILGADWNTVKRHIERQFLPGMTWDNHGEWHIDHIIPLATAKTEAELIKLCHYRNLQPLWAKDNLSKGAKIVEPVQTYLPL